MTSPFSSKHNQDRYSSCPVSVPLFKVHERSQFEEKPDVQPSHFNESQSLQKAYDKLDVRYPYYSCWLFFMIIVSGFFFVYAVVVTFNAFRRYPSIENLDLLIFVAFTGTDFTQYIFEIWAIYALDLAKATSALKIVTVNTCTFLALNVFTGYNLYEQKSNPPPPSESTTFRNVLLTFCLIVTSIFSLTQIFITHFQAIRVRNNLAEREAIRAQLRSR